MQFGFVGKQIKRSYSYPSEYQFPSTLDIYSLDCLLLDLQLHS
ncbi:hypothetical protein RchiOBHm_Chr1g0317971 [Rosa chinensis]|uniref:Uncharacterized protein n=1 Tax=Rosa chinensis TaxID=74649 RepID=A0A2P6S828_ROSCH|nr:hypothetical protein RchiOBHm_Chr1g0317971 [Rosa chinensis]